MSRAATGPAARPDHAEPAPLSGGRLAMAALVLGLANFMVLLDSTIANVSLAHISGSLGVSSSQGTWIITSYAVSEAICVPLTGWLAGRFGTVRTFTFALCGFTLFSTLCGLSSTLGMLIACRVAQGLCGGPLMPLSQTLLLRIFPREKAGVAMSVAAMTTIVAPILGPILGGTISDEWSWPWIFFINLPPAALCLFGVFTLLRRYETPTFLRRVDLVGLAMLVFWVGCFQIMLDLGREHDWFGSPLIIGLAAAAGIGFVAFLIWELTDDQPIVDLRVLRHRGLAPATIALSIGFGTIYSSVVVVPMYLQTVMGYTSTWSGYAMSAMGMFAILLAPIAGRSGKWIDMRITACFGLMWLGVVSYFRAEWSVGLEFWSYTWPQLLQGLGTPFFMIGLMTLGLATVPPRDTASAAGLMAFVRTLATALATSIITTQWADGTQEARAHLTGLGTQDGSFMDQMMAMGMTLQQARGALAQLLEQQGAAIAANHLFMETAVLCILAAQLIWLIPKPKRGGPPAAAGGH